VRRYASFVVRGWRPGVTGALVVAHDQSGERVQTDTLVEAIGWIQSHATTQPGPPSMLRNNAPSNSVRGGARQTRRDNGNSDPHGVATA
jgi:hypothetical protein